MGEALHYLPSLTAFVIGVMMACWLRRLAGARAAPISLLVEIIFLIVVAILHNRTPGVAGTLGISLVAAMQAASFPRVEAWSYSSVMATTNLRRAIESFLNALAGCSDPRPFGRPTHQAASSARASQTRFRTGESMSRPSSTIPSPCSSSPVAG